MAPKEFPSPDEGQEFDPRQFMREQFAKLSDDQKFDVWMTNIAPGAPASPKRPPGSPVAEWVDPLGNPVDEGAAIRGTILYPTQPGAFPKKKVWTLGDIYDLARDANGDPILEELDCIDDLLNTVCYQSHVFQTPAGETVMVPPVIAQIYRRSRRETNDAKTKFPKAIGMDITGYGSITDGTMGQVEAEESAA